MAMTAEITEEPVQLVQDGDASSEDAPFGYMTDAVTGERRPKKRPGRRSKTAQPPSGKTPSVEELQALGGLPETSEDTAPGVAPKGRRKMRAAASAPLPPFRAGVIAKGMNGLYRKAGKIARMFDHDLGTAIIACTYAEDEDDVTVGAAWEELARHNPRVRAFLLKLMVTGVWSDMLRAHLPIFLAIMMKEGIRKRIPLLGLAEALLTDEPESAGGEPAPSGLADMMGGINPQDMAQMMAVAQSMMGQAAAGMQRSQNVPRGPVNGGPWAQDAPREHSADPE